MFVIELLILVALSVALGWTWHDAWIKGDREPGPRRHQQRDRRPW
jgi:hypothetical protein